MRGFVAQAIRETEQFVEHMGTVEWTIAFVVVVGFGILCLKGVGSKTRG
ncbi:hypothetical protein ACYFX5_09035 [Bremerella sp. T1]|nr:hypothetical protein [Bremerella volcania]UBM38397.1 hypothetical protein LA756_10965 [Bremerella volcania]